MCLSCICNIVPFSPDIIVGPPISMNLEAEAFNEELYSHKRFHFCVALSSEEGIGTLESIENDPIEKGDICIVFHNDPSFVFKKMPPKATSGKFEGQYMSPSAQVEFYKNSKSDSDAYCSDEDEDAMEAYSLYIEKQIRRSSMWNIASLMYVLKDECVKSTDVDDFIYDKLVQAAIMIDNKQYDIEEADFPSKIED